MINNNELPLVSFITPVYNGAKYLPELIVSIRDQDYPNLEHIIIDDGSTDNGETVDVLKRYPHLRWWSRENHGQVPTYNEGLDASQGKIICIINADDLITPHAVREAVKYLTKHPQLDGVYGNYKWVDGNSNGYWYQPMVKYAPLSLYRFIPFIAHCSLYIRRDRLMDQGLYFDPSLTYTADYDWIVRLNKAGLKIGHIRATLSMVRYHEQQISSAKVPLVRQELVKVLKKHRVSPFLHRVINAGIDRLIIGTKLFLFLFTRDRAERFRQIRIWVANKRK